MAVRAHAAPCRRSAARPRPIAVLVAAVLTALASSPATAQQRAALVGVDTVREEPLHQTVPVIGRLVARQSGVVAARIGGAVAEMRVEVGDRVARDDVVAVLVNDRLAAARDLRAAERTVAEAELETARAEVALRRQELKRLDGLKASAAFSQGRYEDKRQEVVMAQSEVAEASAALVSAQAELMLAEIDLYNADIRAPYPGVVSRRHTEVGAYVAVGDPVIDLVDDQHLEIEADVPSDRTAGLVPATPVTVEVDGETLRARVRAVVPEENALTRTRTVRFEPAFDATVGLAANQSVVVNVPAGEQRTVVSVHKDAVINRQGKTLVFLVVDGAAQIRPVSLGEAVGTRFEVLDGLQPGDVAVVRGNERLRPGQAVRTPEGLPG